MNCKKCKIPMTTTTAELDGRASEMEVKISGFPYNQCGQCGARAYVDPDFNQFLIEAAVKAIPAARKGGLGRKPACAKCGASLGEAVAAPESIQTSIEVRGYHLAMGVRAPGFACPSCGTHQLQGGARSVSSDWADAMIAAFQPLEPLNFWRAS